MDLRIKEQYIAMVIDKVWKRYSENIILQAVVDCAYSDKITQETINKKVNNRVKLLNDEISLINPFYNDSLKKYDVTKAEILDSITNYENVLKDYSILFDEEIQNTILERVEYETRRLGLLLKDEYLEEKKELREESQKAITNRISNTIKNIMGKMTSKKEEKYIDVSIYNDVMDMSEFQNTVQKRVDEKLEHVKKFNKENDEDQLAIDKKIDELNKKLEDLNNKKIENIINAMESKDTWIAVSNSKQTLKEKIVRFFESKFAISKAVHNRVIVPFNDLIADFKLKEVSKVKAKVMDMEAFTKEVEKVKEKVDKDYKKYRDLNLDKVKQANEIIKVD